MHSDSRWKFWWFCKGIYQYRNTRKLSECALSAHDFHNNYFNENSNLFWHLLLLFDLCGRIFLLLFSISFCWCYCSVAATCLVHPYNNKQWRGRHFVNIMSNALVYFLIRGIRTLCDSHFNFSLFSGILMYKLYVAHSFNNIRVCVYFPLYIFLQHSFTSSSLCVFIVRD